MKRNLIIVFVILFILGVCAFIFFYMKDDRKPLTSSHDTGELALQEFDFKIIKEANNTHKENYMISPLSIGYALSMLNEGAQYNTKKEINSVLDDYKFDRSFQIKDKVSIANLLFIKDKYKKEINKDYIKLIQNDYDSDLIFDEFTTPKKANEWISNKTFNMINNAIENISSDFVLGIANAIAIDVEWKNEFECNRTREEDFTKKDNTTMKVSMMNSSNDASYIKSKNAKGIIKDYAIYDKTTGERVYEENDNTIALEYIAILPNKDIDEYMKVFDKDELNTLLSSKKEADGNLEIHYSIPKYTYDFDYKDFKKSLINLGINDAFNASTANFNKMKTEESDLQLYVGQAIHKTHIELAEKGTKASAVTVFMMMDATSIRENNRKEINITFDKPFIYLIKEKNKGNIWFFGTVYEPDLWDNNINCTIN